MGISARGVRISALAVAISLVVGCATQEQQTRTEAATGGAVAGGLVGSLAGWFAGGKKGALMGAVAGVALGGAGGYVYGDSLANRHAELKGKENDLDARIRYTHDVLADTLRYNDIVEHKIAENNKNITNLTAQVQQGKVDQERLQKQKELIAQQLAEAEKNQAMLKDVLAEEKAYKESHPQAQSKAPAKSNKYEAQIARLAAEFERVKTNTDALAAQSQRL